LVFVVAMLAQVFLIGLGLLGGSASGLSLHRNFGWILHLVPLLILLFAALSRAGKRHWQWALLLAVVVFLIPIFVLLRDSVPVAAALHPVAAVIAFPIALVVGVNSLQALREPPPVPTTT
jgi:hypothetical protein